MITSFHVDIICVTHFFDFKKLIASFEYNVERFRDNWVCEMELKWNGRFPDFKLPSEKSFDALP